MFGFKKTDQHIIFAQRQEKVKYNAEKESFSYYGFSRYEKSTSNIPKLSLFSKQYNFNPLEVMPRLFTITTNTSSANFNIYILQDTSSVIADFLLKNPNQNQYHLDIDDNYNVLHKFELLYQGDFVIFDEDELHISQKITKLLNIVSCPNFMIPESLKYAEGYKYVADIHQKQLKNFFGVQMNFYSFIVFLQNKLLRTFTIVTNKNQYKCNAFGVYSSNIIRKLLEEDPTKDIFVYNFDDECNEFQLICDLFNFNSVILTKNNIDSIKEIAEELEIGFILNDIDKFIVNFKKVSQSIDEHQAIVDTIENLFDLLYNIKTKTVKTVKTSIVESEWSKTEDDVKELAAFIIQVILTDMTLHQPILELLIQLDQESNESNKLGILMHFVAKQLLRISFNNKNLSSNIIKKGTFSYKKQIDQIQVSNSNFSFIYLLYKNGIISKDDLYDYLKNLKDNPYPYPYLWFLPELKEMNLIDWTKQFHLSEIEKNFLSSYLPDKIDNYKRMRDNGEPDDELTKAIRKDDVDTVQKILSNYNKDDLNCIIPMNIFENFVPNGQTSFIDYAAAYSSLKCFKFLLLNHHNITTSTFKLAIFGGNIEIIKITDQKNQKVTNNSEPGFNFSKPLGKNTNKFNNSDILLAIQRHRNDLFDWIFETKMTDVKSELLKDLFFSSVLNGNAYSLTSVIDRGFNYIDNKSSFEEAIFISAKNGFYLLTQLIYNLMGNDVSFHINDNPSLAFYDNISIFKIFVKDLTQKNLNVILNYSLRNGLMGLIKFFMETHDKNKFILDRSNAFKMLEMSLDHRSNHIFLYFINQYKIIAPKIFKAKFFMYQKILNKVCKLNNIEAAKIIINLILNNNIKNYDFTDDFITSLCSGALDICNYFIEMKLPINYEMVSYEFSNIKSINDEIFYQIINNVTPEAKVRIIQCFDIVIKNKNAILVKLMLKENPEYSYSLLNAAEANSLEIVELILNYNSQPSFINKLGPHGTALMIATVKSNLKIVQKLLSIPGIDPTLYIKKNDTPLIHAIVNYNLEITNALLEFYGDNIQIVNWQVKNALALILEKTSNSYIIFNDNNGVIKAMINRLVCIKGIDFSTNYSVLLYACFSNNIELTQNLLKLDTINVNLIEPHTGNTPLIIAIKSQNVDIAKLLIKHPQTNINQASFDQQTALTYAVDYNLEEIIDLIINNDKFNPVESRLNYSFYKSSKNISKKLCECKSLDVNYGEIKPVQLQYISHIDKTVTIFRTSLIAAVDSDDLEKVDLIINHPSFDKNKSQIKMALFNTVEKDKFSLFKKLIEFIDDLNIYDITGKNLLYYCVTKLKDKYFAEILNNPLFDSKKNEILNIFVASFSNIEYRYDESFSKSIVQIMNMLCEYDEKHDHLIDFTKLLPDGQSFFTKISTFSYYHTEICNYLLKKGVDPNKPSENGTYPLEYAIYISSLKLVTALIDSGKIDFSKRLKNNSTYLHIAAKSYPEILSIFLNKKLIDINATNDYGETPLFEASRSNIKENIQLLFNEDNLDYLHRNKNGKDIFAILSKKTSKEPKTREEYLKFLLHVELDSNESNSDM